MTRYRGGTGDPEGDPARLHMETLVNPRRKFTPRLHALPRALPDSTFQYLHNRLNGHPRPFEAAAVSLFYHAVFETKALANPNELPAPPPIEMRADNATVLEKL